MNATYQKGDIIFYNWEEYIFNPKKDELQFSIGQYPSKKNGWRKLKKNRK